MSASSASSSSRSLFCPSRPRHVAKSLQDRIHPKHRVYGWFRPPYGASKFKYHWQLPYKRLHPGSLYHYPEVSRTNQPERVGRWPGTGQSGDHKHDDDHGTSSRAKTYTGSTVTGYNSHAAIGGRPIDWYNDEPQSGYEFYETYGENTIELTNIPMGITPERMQERFRRWFGKFGHVKHCRVLPHSHDPYQCSGVGYVTFEEDNGRFPLKMFGGGLGDLARNQVNKLTGTATSSSSAGLFFSSPEGPESSSSSSDGACQQQEVIMPHKSGRRAVWEAMRAPLKLPESLHSRVIQMRSLDNDKRSDPIWLKKQEHWNEELVGIVDQLYESLLNRTASSCSSKSSTTSSGDVQPLPLEDVALEFQLLERSRKPAGNEKTVVSIAQEAVWERFGGSWERLLTFREFGEMFLIFEYNGPPATIRNGGDDDDQEQEGPSTNTTTSSGARTPADAAPETSDVVLVVDGEDGNSATSLAVTTSSNALDGSCPFVPGIWRRLWWKRRGRARSGRQRPRWLRDKRITHDHTDGFAFQRDIVEGSAARSRYRKTGAVASEDASDSAGLEQGGEGSSCSVGGGAEKDSESSASSLWNSSRNIIQRLFFRARRGAATSDEARKMIEKVRVPPQASGGGTKGLETTPPPSTGGRDATRASWRSGKTSETAAHRRSTGGSGPRQPANPSDHEQQWDCSSSTEQRAFEVHQGDDLPLPPPDESETESRAIPINKPVRLIPGAFYVSPKLLTPQQKQSLLTRARLSLQNRLADELSVYWRKGKMELPNHTRKNAQLWYHKPDLPWRLQRQSWPVEKGAPFAERAVLVQQMRTARNQIRAIKRAPMLAKRKEEKRRKEEERDLERLAWNEKEREKRVRMLRSGSFSFSSRGARGKPDSSGLLATTSGFNSLGPEKVRLLEMLEDGKVADATLFQGK